jgi:putative flavoprotein involved in K+ transport
VLLDSGRTIVRSCTSTRSSTVVTRTETVIVGAGQAGLALSRHLTALGHPHVLLDRGRVAERWRSERWDSFRLLTPNWQLRLPGHAYSGADRDGFMTRDQIVGFLERYARSFDAPVRTGVTVHRVRAGDAGWLVETNAGTFEAANVVVATGHHGVPRIPLPCAQRLPADVLQYHTSHYRRPEHLPDGGVLVVGAGPSGQQIADELALAGRTVVLAAGRHRTLPRRYRGHDVHWWLDRMGAFERTIDSLADPLAVRSAPAFVLAAGHHDLDLRRLVDHGVIPVGRLAGVMGSTAWFADDLAATVAKADANANAFRSAVDDFVARTGLVADDPDDPPPPAGVWAQTAPRLLHLSHLGIGTVIWATGFRRDFSWIDADVFDADGEPVQRRGVTAAPGLYFLGLRWMHRRGSDTIHGVGADAEHLARVISHRSPALSADPWLPAGGHRVTVPTPHHEWHPPT